MEDISENLSKRNDKIYTVELISFILDGKKIVLVSFKENMT